MLFMTPESLEIRWRIHLRSSPSRVFTLLDASEGRSRFWAASANEVAPGVIDFQFTSGEHWRSRILERRPPHRLVLTYFEGSVATFDLMSSPDGGTNLMLTESGVPASAWKDHHAGWVSLLLILKATADFDVDLRNGDPRRPWNEGWVDV